MTFDSNVALTRPRNTILSLVSAALTASLLGCDAGGASQQQTSPSAQASSVQGTAAPAAVQYRCFAEPGFFRGADAVSLEEDSVSYVEQRTGERGEENRLVILSLATGEATASDWFRRPCSQVVRFAEGVLALCSLTQSVGSMSNGLYYFERSKLDAASIEAAKAIGTRPVFRFVGNAQIAYYQTNEKEIVRLTPDLKGVQVAKGTPHQLDEQRLLYVDEKLAWNSLAHDKGAGQSSALPGAEFWRKLPGGGTLGKKDGAFVAKDASGADVDASATPKGLEFFMGDTAVLTDGKTTHTASSKAGKLELQPWFAVEGGQLLGVWSRAQKPPLVQAARDTNLDGEVGSGDRSQWCVLQQNVTRLAFAERTAQEKELSAAVAAKLQSLGLDGAKFELSNHGTLLAVVTAEANDTSLEALKLGARQLHEVAEKVEPRLRAVLIRHEPQLRQALSRRSESGHLLGYSGSYGALLPDASDFSFSYEAVTTVVTGRSDVTPRGATCNFSARSLGKEPVQAQFDCQLLGPTLYWDKFEPGTLTHLDDAPVLSQVLTLGPQNQKLSLRAPGDRNLKARTYPANSRASHIEKSSDGFDTRLVAAGKQWMALGASMHERGARFIDPDYHYAEPFAHTRLLPRVAVDDAATDAQVKPLARKLLALLDAHYRRHLGRETTTFLLRRGDQNGRYDGNTDALSWQAAQ